MAYLDYTKKTSVERFISVLDGVGSSIVHRYPSSEVQSWTLQKTEAEKFLATPVAQRTVGTAPFIAQVCRAHHGYVNDATLLQQIADKSVIILANAELWAMITAYVNGFRAKVEDLIEAATTEDEVLSILHQSITELEQFRNQYSV